MIGNVPRFLSYQAGTTFLHRLDPRTKLLCTVAIVGDALIASVPLGIAIAFAFAAVMGLMASDLLPALWRLLRPLLVLIVLFGLIITVITPGHALAHFWLLAPTRDGVDLAIRLGLQAVLIVYTTSLLTLSTPPLAVADSLQWSLGWLERFHIPIRDIIAMVGIGLTFVPLLIDEAQKVISAQRARGADLGMNALLDESSMGALLIPLLLANLRRGEDLAESMEARLYGTGPRTSLAQPRFRSIDRLAGGAVVLVSVVVAIVSFVHLSRLF
ncbi:MAG TPA: energy-coupling factor transporter transmembrane component T [Chloroflexota bacterium]